LDDPDSSAGSDGRNEYAIACILFLWFAVLPNLVAFPLASVPTFLGEKLSRAASAWTLLAAVAAYVLKDAAQRGRIHSGSTFRYLRRGLIASCGAHLLLVAFKMAGGVALPCPKASVASLVMHGLVVFAALTPPPKVQKPKTSSAAASTVEASKVQTPKSSPAATSTPLRVGKKVMFQGKSGTIRYVGPTNFAAGEWVGLELEDGSGKHDGSVFGQRYFRCAQGHGLLISADQL